MIDSLCSWQPLGQHSSHCASREQDSKGRQSLLHGLQSNGNLAAIGKKALHNFQRSSLLQAGSRRAMAGNHSQTACEAMANLQQRARRPCERLRSAGVSPLTGTAATANPTSAPHNRCIFLTCASPEERASTSCYHRDTHQYLLGQLVSNTGKHVLCREEGLPASLFAPYKGELPVDGKVQSPLSRIDVPPVKLEQRFLCCSG